MSESYDQQDHDAIEKSLAMVRAEVIYAKTHGGTYILLQLTDCRVLAMLLRELGEIAIHAPGGHGFLVDQANAWASTFAAEATQP